MLDPTRMRAGAVLDGQRKTRVVRGSGPPPELGAVRDIIPLAN
jgi:hypothetical protein